jgi:hypothetical protein
MGQEQLALVVFSGFMVVVVGLLVGNLLVALYRERKARRGTGGGPPEE